MPYCRKDGVDWQPDLDLFEAMPGGQKLSEWFGFATSFHDAALVGIDLVGPNAKLTIEAFRMTSKTDANGFYVLDRHATVTLTLTGVTHAAITSELPTTLLELGIRRLGCEAEGSVEVAFDDVVGEGGSIIAGGIEADFVPTIVSADGKSS